MKCNLREWIEETANGEPVEAVVIGDMGWKRYRLEDIPEAARDESKWNRCLTWEEAAPLLSYDFSCGYGAPGCQAVVAWTKSRVIFISQYDGSTSPEWVPRNPTDHEPQMPGG